MCGFAGIVAWDDKYHVTRPLLEKMSARIAHRGPDGQGLYLNHEQEATPQRPQVGLIHRRLAILDPDPRSNQPFKDEAGRRLVFNGEIYNYRELRQELKSLRPDYEWRTVGDTEVLLLAYAVWGEKCVDHLNGMFAFAVWDATKQQLFLARDRMGQKPLYVAIAVDAAEQQGDGYPILQFDGRVAAVAVASELPALRTLPWFNTTVRQNRIGAYLTYGYLTDVTIYEGALKLQPATWSRIGPTGANSGHYFRPYAAIAAEDIGDPAAPANARELVLTAVRRQLVSDVPIGCFLSGGIDSSVVAFAMRAAIPQDQSMSTFSIGFDDPRYDESEHAAAVAKYLGTTHHRFIVRPNVIEDLPRIASVFGEPFADSSAIPTHYLSRETRLHVKVALSGDGADELFGGYDRYRALRITQSLARLPIGRVFLQPLRLLPGTHPKGRITRLKRLLRSAHLPPAERYAAYVRLFDPVSLRGLFKPDLQDSFTGGDQFEHFFNVGLTARPAVPNALAIDRCTYLPEDLLTKVDRCSMLHALEVRSPFMDHELVHFAANLSTPQLLRGGPKRMLREAFAADLPAFVFKRKKMGFAVPIGEWFRGELRPMLRDHLFAADSFAQQHFVRKTVERLVDEHETQRVDHSQRLYALLMLELWWRTSRT